LKANFNDRNRLLFGDENNIMADSVKTIINLKNGVIEIDNSNADSPIIKLKNKAEIEDIKL